MRSAGAGLFGALLMVAPLVAIPIFAVVGVPQFAPAVSPVSRDVDASADEFDADELDDGERSSRKVAARSSRGGTAKRRTADDLYAALPEPLTTPSDESESPSARPWSSATAHEAASEAASAEEPATVDGSAIARQPRASAPDGRRPSRRVWSNNAPRGSLGEWELDEETGAPSAGEAETGEAPPEELASLGESGSGRAREAARGEFEPERDAPEPLNEAGAINFLAKGTADRKPATRVREADQASSRTSAPAYKAVQSAPRRGGRPIPSDDVDTELPTVTEPGEASESELAPDDEVDTVSEADLQRGFAGDPLGTKSSSSRAGSSKAPVRYASTGGAGSLDFPEPSADDFANAQPLGNGRPDAPIDDVGTDAGDASNGDVPSDATDGEAGGTDAIATSTAESMTWKQATAQLKAWGIRKYRLEADPETEGFVFVCMAPDPNSTKVTRRFEASGGDPLSAVRSAIGQISDWYSNRTRRD